MNVNLYSFLGLYDKALVTLGAVLDKGAERAKALGVTTADMLEWRLIDDMYPLRFQAQMVVNFTRQWPARVAGLEPPPGMAEGIDLAGIHAAISDARAYIAAIRPEQFEGREDVPVTVKLGDIMEPTLPAAQWLTGFATTNIYFHLSIAYAILRARGADLGKRDMFAGGI